LHSEIGSILAKEGAMRFGSKGIIGKNKAYLYWKLNQPDQISSLIAHLLTLPELSLADEDPNSRNIEEWVKQEVWERDGGKCRVCGRTSNLHFDHDIPFSKGGGNHPKNVKLLCAEHNLEKSSSFKY
jgi:hypothetical protein